ncbi:transcriptional regulator [Paenibacillus sp. VTT E-133280]|jgi:DNA-binding HxlR family transcriptional regulator|uniref:Transcriptional regulator n=3 Tax=Paenibacillus TaxID=44249 RepID=A0A1R0ZHW7_9BACL|nr:MULTISPECIES: helix-turn-helix domain-containing protein [Paenibacillus]MBY3626197.1 helix-turn-helix transcriptional regulator [Acinetobacter sp. CUI P1]AIQ25342.1 HxlR family transcriptional regulator [Paenibacillus sp. FSL H7-0737]AIQ37062.1 HxlR family transcriptional regulator [Paenibacillus sp. FSL R5-0345]KAA1181462.1 helix-turn-helix transcriptional regulator [Paenibacillus sp. B2(2019)]KTD86965.1 HxlR family transcriptional regulator [Paenibacillus etheri]
MEEHQFAMCPRFETAFSFLGKRWNGLIIQTLMSGPKRFKDISGLIPSMSDKMLSERMKDLEGEGILVRHVYPETPVRIEYELTDKGRALQPVMQQIQSWAESWVD